MLWRWLLSIADGIWSIHDNAHRTAAVTAGFPLAHSQNAPHAPVSLVAACVAEGIGTFTLVFAGCGAIMIDTLSHGQVTHVGVGLVFGLVIAAMVYATGHISGAHLNPAVTLGFVVTRHFPLRRMAGYWLAQVTGAIAAALSLRLLLGDAAHLGATMPMGVGGAWQSFALESQRTAQEAPSFEGGEECAAVRRWHYSH